MRWELTGPEWVSVQMVIDALNSSGELVECEVGGPPHLATCLVYGQWGTYRRGDTAMLPLCDDHERRPMFTDGPGRVAATLTADGWKEATP